MIFMDAVEELLNYIHEEYYPMLVVTEDNYASVNLTYPDIYLAGKQLVNASKEVQTIFFTDRRMLTISSTVNGAPVADGEYGNYELPYEILLIRDCEGQQLWGVYNGKVIDKDGNDEFAEPHTFEVQPYIKFDNLLPIVQRAVVNFAAPDFISKRLGSSTLYQQAMIRREQSRVELNVLPFRRTCFDSGCKENECSEEIPCE